MSNSSEVPLSNRAILQELERRWDSLLPPELRDSCVPYQLSGGILFLQVKNFHLQDFLQKRPNKRVLLQCAQKVGGGRIKNISVQLPDTAKIRKQLQGMEEQGKALYAQIADLQHQSAQMIRLLGLLLERTLVTEALASGILDRLQLQERRQNPNLNSFHKLADKRLEALFSSVPQEARDLIKLYGIMVASPNPAPNRKQ